jgi:retron-type reverse transcriptase
MVRWQTIVDQIYVPMSQVEKEDQTEAWNFTGQMTMAKICNIDVYMCLVNMRAINKHTNLTFIRQNINIYKYHFDTHNSER